MKKENSIGYYIKRYFKKIEGYEKLIPSGSKPGKLYGMAKIHKTDIPLRPVVSMVGTPEYNYAKYLDSLIKSCWNSSQVISVLLNTTKSNKYRSFYLDSSI